MKDRLLEDAENKQSEMAGEADRMQEDMTTRATRTKAEMSNLGAKINDNIVHSRAERTSERAERSMLDKDCDCMPVGGLGSPATYTLDEHFDLGDLNNVVHTPSDQLRLAEDTEPFPFLWVAVSYRDGMPGLKGTIAKIDTRSGEIVGEYLTSPTGQPANPSRTTVDPWGNVWATNRDGNSVVRVGMVENHQCIDHNGIPGIQTSTGQGDIRPWDDPGGIDTGGSVSTAADDCIIAYTRSTAQGTRHISVSLSQDVWVSGTIPGIDPATGLPFPQSAQFDLVRPDGVVLQTEPGVGYGGYGGITDKQGVIWSSGGRGLLRWDTGVPLANLQVAPPAPAVPAPAPGPVTGYPAGTTYGSSPYGLCVDSAGNVWNTAFGDGMTSKFAPDGTLINRFPHGGPMAQGCVVDLNDEVWVAHSLAGGSQTVGHLKNDGTYLGNVTVGQGPTGAAVDRDGAIWVTNYGGRSVTRIDPTMGPIGLDGATPVGAPSPVGAMTSPHIDLMGRPYDYSDMTGSAVPVHPKSGSWEVVYDCGAGEANWGPITRTATTPPGSSLIITAASSTDGITFSDPVPVTPGLDPGVPSGRYLKVRVVFLRSTTNGQSPVLHDLTVQGTDPTITDCCEPKDGIDPPPDPLDPEPPVATTPVSDPVPDEPIVVLAGPKLQTGAQAAPPRQLPRTGFDPAGLLAASVCAFGIGFAFLASRRSNGPATR